MSNNQNILRSEFAFLYESVFANANGDPLNGNRPRIDEETGLQYVTMYRIKRTVRDYLKLLNLLEEKKGNSVLLKEAHYKKGKETYVKTLEMLLSEEVEEINISNITEAFIDTRLFGGLFAVKNNHSKLQGPVQISYGKSLHQVDELDVQMAPVFASEANKKNGTLGLSYIVPYSLIGIDGTINQFNAKKTNLTQDDVDLFFKALWNGTSELKTTSKNQKALLLANVSFNKDNQLHTIGNLKEYFKINSDLEDVAIRGTDDYTVDITDFVEKMNLISDKLEKVELTFDSKLQFTYQGEVVENLESLIPKLIKKVL